MAQQLIKMRIQFRRDTAENWLLNKDVVPEAGEPCFETDTGVFKIGDGVTAYENLQPIGGVNVAADGQSIVFENDAFRLAGFDAAEVGAQPRKTADGGLEWVVAAEAEEVKDLKAEVESLKTNVSAMQDILVPSDGVEQPLLSRVETLEGSMDVLNGTGEGSIKKIAQDEAAFLLNDFATKISDDGTVNTFKELVDYAAEHNGAAGTLIQDVTTLKELVGSTSVSEQIVVALDDVKEEQIIPLQEAINQFHDVYLNKLQAKAEFEHVQYEVSHKPVGTLVNYRDKEIRIMCPADTKFELQNSGEGADANTYYIGFKAYAPAGAVSFKEDLAEIIADETMYTFEGNEFAGTDEYGRKYSIVWLPVAKNENGVWTYHGAKSSVNKYIGWHYSVEWYNADGMKIVSDTIRINLSNEACHNKVEPYYMAGIVKEISFNGTAFDTVDGKVDIVYEDEMDVKASEEITIAEDGTLGIGTISFSKIEQTDGEYVIFDGGGASM